MNVTAAELAGSPGLGLGFTLLTKTYESIKNVKVHRKRCENVHRQCLELLVALQESGQGLEGTPTSGIIDEIESLVRQVESKSREWADYSNLKSYLLQGEIQEGLEELDRRIDTLNLKFSFKTNTEAARINYAIYNAHQSAQMEIRELLAQLVRDVEKLVKEGSATNPIVEEVMQGLQTELRADDLEPEHQETFKKGLWMLHEKTRKLPPCTDLTGQVERTSRHRVAAGTHNDIYRGIWLGKEDVALRLPNLPPADHGVQKRFERDLTIWRNLDHPNIVPLYGIIYHGSDVFSVSPWMDNGKALDYLKKFPDGNRFRIIEEVAKGLEYLHRKGIIHGDLRAENILINKEGVACISDFGLSKMLEDLDHRGSTTAPNWNPRWCAPELLRPNVPVSRMSDVWSFGMASLEILSGERPYVTIRNDMAVYNEVYAGRLPDRPASRYISDPVWSLFKKCWDKKPASRPTISEVRGRLESILGGHASVTRSPNTSPRSLKSPKLAPLLSPAIRKPASILRFGQKPDKRSSSASSSPASSLGPVKPHSTVAFLTEDPKSMVSHASSSSPRTPPHPPRVELTMEEELEDQWHLSPLQGVSIPNNPVAGPSGSPRISISPLSVTDPLAHLANLPRSIRSTDSSSHHSSTIRAAVVDPNIIIKSLRDGTVACGTLEGLVERLINGFNRPRDQEFREILLSCTVDFITAEEFFSVIERRFYDADRTVNGLPEDRVRIQLNILAVLKFWVTTPHLPIDTHLVLQMRNFCRNAMDRSSGLTMKRKAEKVILALNNDIRASSLPPPLEGPPMDARDMDSPNLAIGLTLMESDRFKQIYPSDYLVALGGGPCPPAIRAAKEVNSKIVKWAQKVLLHYNNIYDRIQVMNLLLNTAKECLALNNFSSASAIALAFNSRWIDDLQYSIDHLEQSSKTTLTRLRTLFGKDRQEYHAMFINASNRSADRIPWLEVYLEDLQAILDQHPPTFDVDGHTLINFERYMHFRAYLDEHAPPSRSSYTQLNDRHRNDGQLAYLESKMNNVDLADMNADRELEEKAHQIRLSDLHAKRNRVIEVATLGFQSSQRKRSS